MPGASSRTRDLLRSDVNTAADGLTTISRAARKMGEPEAARRLMTASKLTRAALHAITSGEEPEPEVSP